MLLKNISLQENKDVLFHQNYPSIYVGNNKQINDFINGYLSQETLIELYKNLLEFFQNFQPQHYHQGSRIITLDDNWQKFIQENKQDFRFNSKNNQLIYLQKEMTNLQKKTFKSYFSDIQDQQVFDDIFQGLDLADLKKIKHRLKDLEPSIADLLIKLFDNKDFFKTIISYTNSNGTITEQNDLSENLKQISQLNNYFSNLLSGIPNYTIQQLQEDFKQEKLSLINYFFLLSALTISDNRKQKYQFINSRLYLIDGEIRNLSTEITQLIELVPDEQKDFVRYISTVFFAQTEPTLLKQLASKSIAVGGGKGGVGKSLTSVNLALNYSMQGYRTAIIDLDPTSNISIILDLRSPENIYYNRSSEITQLNDLEENILSVGENLDILFSKQKLIQGDSLRLLNKLYINYLNKLNQDYDILIMDLPAGNHLDDNLIFAPFIDNFLSVTTNEPTARKSCGGYIKSLLEVDPQKNIFIWHNKIDPEYQVTDFITDYNRMSSTEEKLDPQLEIINLGYIPETNYLKITLTKPDPQDIILNLLADTLKTISTNNVSLNKSIEITLTILKDPERRKNATKIIKQTIDELLQDQQLVDKYTNNLKLLTSYYALLLLAKNKSIANKIDKFIPVYNSKISPRDKHQQIMELLAKQSKEKELADNIFKVFNSQLNKLDFPKNILPNESQQFAIVMDFCTEALYSGMGMLAPLGKRVAAQQFREQAQKLLQEIGLAN